MDGQAEGAALVGNIQRVQQNRYVHVMNEKLLYNFCYSMELQRACEEAILGIESYQKLVKERCKSTLVLYLSLSV